MCEQCGEGTHGGRDMVVTAASYEAHSGGDEGQVVAGQEGSQETP